MMKREAKVRRMTGPVTPHAYTARMARSSEVIRQWEILRTIDSVRNGIGIAKLASERRRPPADDPPRPRRALPRRISALR